MRRVEQLIGVVRKMTENVRIGASDGIDDEEFIEVLNDAQELCQSAIVTSGKKTFGKEWSFSAPGTESKTLPLDIWARHRILTVEYSASGNEADYYHLKQASLIERSTSAGNPSRYTLLADKILFDRYPSGGTFRIVYDPLLRRLDKRRAVVVTPVASSTQLTALTIGGALFVQADYDLFDEISIVHADGTVLMSGIPFTAVSALGVLTMSAFTFATGETCPVGAFVCLGRNASPTSALPDQCEKFLKVYGARRILDRDSSSDRATMKEDEQFMLGAIVEEFADVSGDIDEIPQTNCEDFLDSEFE